MGFVIMCLGGILMIAGFSIFVVNMINYLIHGTWNPAPLLDLLNSLPPDVARAIASPEPLYNLLQVTPQFTGYFFLGLILFFLGRRIKHRFD